MAAAPSSGFAIPASHLLGRKLGRETLSNLETFTEALPEMA